MKIHCTKILRYHPTISNIQKRQASKTQLSVHTWMSGIWNTGDEGVYLPFPVRWLCTVDSGHPLLTFPLWCFQMFHRCSTRLQWTESGWAYQTFSWLTEQWNCSTAINHNFLLRRLITDLKPPQCISIDWYSPFSTRPTRSHTKASSDELLIAFPLS